MTSTITSIITQHTPCLTRYEELYRHLHQTPELPYQESETAKVISQWLSNLSSDIEVKTSIGGHGVVGILRNGPGKTMLLRAELDALPLAEVTGLPYASTKTMHSGMNQRVEPVMHACGHDLHMCAQLAACELLVRSRNNWSGTVIAAFQPAEETGMGAKFMFEDGLFDVAKHGVPVPDVGLGGHCMPLPAGVVKTRVGVINGSCDNIRVTLYGRGGHGSRPHTTCDPVVLACSIVIKLQTIVSRQINPLETAVVTVGSIHAGSAANIIPDEAVIELNLRTFTAETRNRLIELSAKFINSEAEVWGCPKPPLFESIGMYPIVDNDKKETLFVAEAFGDHFGDAFALDATQSAGSEDFAALFGDLPVPIVFWNYGCIDPDTWNKAVANNTVHSIPGNHSPGFAPVVQPSLTMGLEAYAAAALAYLKK